MIIAHINTLAEGSTGNIMLGIGQEARKTGHTVYTFSSRVFRRTERKQYPPIPSHFYYGSGFSNLIHKVFGQVSGFNGFFSLFSTLQLLRQLSRLKIEAIHLHNLHEFCMNLPLLFRYIKKRNISVIWTLHDCWSFTGHCPHYVFHSCSNWKTGCRNCPQLNVYPKSLIDATNVNWKLKRRIFTGINHMVIATPSRWLAEQVKESFLKDYPVKVIHNGIDLDVFQPVESDFRARHNCEGKKLVLGVAFGWGQRKGLDVFIELAKRLPEEYRIVLVGTDDKTDAQLPENIISIHRTQNPRELAQIYSAADVFANPTREDTFPTVNIEALACGTPVVTFQTGGSPEILDETCGIVVPYNDIDRLEQAIIHVCSDHPFSKEACLARGRQFSREDKFREYIELYNTISR